MNKKFNESEIILGRLPQNKVVPMLIIKANNEIFGLQLYKYKPQQETKNPSKNKKNKNSKCVPQKRKNRFEVFIDQPEGLNFKSVVNITKKLPLEDVHKIKILSRIDRKLYKKIVDKYNAFVRDGGKDYRQLHQELHDLNLKIEMCKMNNERYDMYVQQRNIIAKKLGYSGKTLTKRKGTRRSLDYIEPIHTPYITVYRF